MKTLWMRGVGWFWYRFAQLVLSFLAVFYWRMRIVGRKNLPTSGAFLFCPNHRSNLDGPLTCIARWGRMRYFAKKEIFRYEWLGNIFIAMGAIPVDRESPSRDSLKKCFEALAKGHPLVLFPEGARQSGPEIAEVHEGAAYIALKAGVPIVPVGMSGTEAANPKGSWLFLPKRITMEIGEPIDVTRFGAPGRVRRGAIDELSAELRRQLQSLYQV